MIVSGKYELLDMIQEHGVRTYRARHVGLRQAVLVHFIPETIPGDAFSLLERLAALPDTDRRLFIDAGEHDASPYLVSWELPGFDNLPDWLDRAIRTTRGQAAAGPQKSGPPAPAGGTRQAKPSEFTQMFFRDFGSAPGAPQPQAIPPPAATGRAPANPPAASAPGAEKPGEFTQFFGPQNEGEAPGRPERQPAPPLPAAARTPAASAPDSAKPGEFTDFFDAGAGARRAAEPDPHKERDAGPGPSKIVHQVVVFGPPPVSRRPPDSHDDVSPPKRPETAAQPASARPDWLDDVFPNAKRAESAAPVAPAAGARPDWLDDVLPPQRGQAGRRDDPIVHNEPAVGGYTRVITTRPSANPPAAPPPPAPCPAKPAASPKPDFQVLWIGLGALAIIAMLVILFFVLRR
jgi:hypothetical protein